MAKSKQTMGKVAFRGKIFGLSKAKDNIVDNEKQRKLSFIIKTDNDNAHYVTVNQWKGSMKKAYLFKNVDDGENEQKVTEWENRYKFVDDGFEPIGVKTKAKNSEDTMSLYEYDFIDFLIENFEDGDSVFFRGKATFSEGDKKVYHNFEPTHFYPTSEDIDFNEEDFKETSDFNLSLVFKDASVIDDKVFVNGYIFDWKEVPILEKFIVEDTEPDLQKYLMKEAGYGDVFPVEGVVHNRVTYKEKESEKPEGSGLGKKRGSFDNSYTNREIDSERKELQLVYSEMPLQGVYSKKDIEAFKNQEKKEGKSSKSENFDAKKDKPTGMPWDK
jgi:hypothetical protein